MEQKKYIYEILIEKNLDVFSMSSKSHEIRELWVWLDSSIFVLLTSHLLDGRKVRENEKEEFSQLIKAFATRNVNYHPFTLIEAAKFKSKSELDFNYDKNRALNHIKALLIAQCIDLDTFYIEENCYWQLSDNKVQKLLKQYPQIQANDLDSLAQKVFDDYDSQNMKWVNNINEKIGFYTIPILRLIQQVNNEKKSVEEKIIRFIDEIKKSQFPYFPKIIDFCIKVLLNESNLLHGASRKIKKEAFNTAFDMVIYDIAEISNFSEPFDDLKPINIFLTLDKNLAFYASLKGTLVLNFDGNFSKMYYPDLSPLKKMPRAFDTAISYFKKNDPNQVKQEMLYLTKNNPNNQELIEKLEKIDFNEMDMFKHQNETIT